MKIFDAETESIKCQMKSTVRENGQAESSTGKYEMVPPNNGIPYLPSERSKRSKYENSIAGWCHPVFTYIGLDEDFILQHAKN